MMSLYKSTNLDQILFNIDVNVICDGLSGIIELTNNYLLNIMQCAVNIKYSIVKSHHQRFMKSKSK